jgi:hypothetical protein
VRLLLWLLLLLLVSGGGGAAAAAASSTTLLRSFALSLPPTPSDHHTFSSVTVRTHHHTFSPLPPLLRFKTSVEYDKLSPFPDFRVEQKFADIVQGLLGATFSPPGGIQVTD